VSAPRTPPKVPRPEPAPIVETPAPALAHAGATPVVTPAGPGESIVTFLWRDAEAEEVLLFVNRITDERRLADSLMRRVPGSDLWHLSYRMRSDWRASYGFVPRTPGRPWAGAEGGQLAIRRALDGARADPRNPASCRNRAGTSLSVVSLPDAPPQPWLARRGRLAARGTVGAHAGPDGRTVRVYEPAVPGDGPLPVAIVLDGEVWTGVQDLATTVDNLLDDGELRPSLLVMPESGGRDRRWEELGAGDGPDWLADALLPWARARWPLSDDPADVVVAGQSLGALTALRTVLERPDAARGALSQSASLWQQDLLAAVGARDRSGIRVYQEVGSQEWVLREPNARLAAGLAAAGAELRFVEYDGGHDYACWRGGIADGLRYLLGTWA